MSIIDHLPVELLTYIFACGINDESDLFQVLVSHVCRLWRDLSINTPAFWCHLTFSEGPPYDKSQTWIQRSKDLPLTIEIDCYPGLEYPDVDDDDDDDDDDTSLLSFSGIASCEDINAVLDIIEPHIGRWHVLDIMVSRYQFMHSILSRLSQCPAAPLLQVLVLHHYEDTEATDTDVFQPADLGQHFLPFHGIAPNLKVLKLWGVHIDWSTPFLTDLYHFEVAFHARNVRPSWQDFSRILRDSPNLEVLGLCMSGPATLPSDITADSIIQLPALTDLLLSYHDPVRVSQLVKLHRMPKLRKLRLELEDGDFSSFLVEELASVPSGQTSSLLSGIETLKIASLPCNHASINRMYEQLRNLKEIELSANFIDPAFFQLLVPRCGQNASNVYCPNLMTIATSGIKGKLVMKLIQLRNAAGCPIKRVSMTSDDELKFGEEEWIKDHVEFQYYEPSDEDDDDDDDDALDVFETDDDDLDEIDVY